MVQEGKRVCLEVERLNANNDSLSKRNMEFIMGTRKMITGFEQALYQLKQEDTAQITIRSDYAYGKIGQPADIGPDENLFFIVKVTEVGEPNE